MDLVLAGAFAPVQQRGVAPHYEYRDENLTSIQVDVVGSVVLTGKVLFPLSYSRGGGKKFTCQFYPAQGNKVELIHFRTMT